ncbi:hypothetical protein D3C87_1247900 [compost metagenome]
MRLDVRALQIHDRGFQARHAQGREVVGVLPEIGLLSRPGKVLDHLVGGQVDTAAARPLVHQAALVGLDEVAAIAHPLMPHRHRVPTVGVGDHRSPGAVVDFTVVVVGVARHPITLRAAGGRAVGTARRGAEVAQVGGQ